MSNTSATDIGVQPIRRIVTADVNGRSTIVEDASSPWVMQIRGIERHAVTDLWKTTASPAPTGAPEVCAVPVQLAPPDTGTVFRVVEFPPDAEWMDSVDTQAAFASMGQSGADALHGTHDAHPFMHRTRSVDYAIVLQGEIWAVLDETETLMRAGDVLIQRGTNHAWANRSQAQCLVAFVLVDGRF